MQSIGAGETRKAVGTLQKLVPETRPPVRRLPCQILDRLQSSRAGVGAADENRKRVIEAEWRQQRASAARVQVADGRVHAP